MILILKIENHRDKTKRRHEITNNYISYIQGFDFSYKITTNKMEESISREAQWGLPEQLRPRYHDVTGLV